MKEKYAAHRISLNRVVEALGQDEEASRQMSRTVTDLLRKHGDVVYRDAVYHIAHLDLPPGEAKSLWGNILSHKQDLMTRLGRNVGIHVATLDYFHNVEKRISEPKIIETRILEEIQDASGKDALTGLFNYSSFKDRIQREISRASRYGKVFSLILFDIDWFKKYNDTYGHKEGDAVLKRIADCMMAHVRKSDFVARYGGEEFVVILVETAKKGAAEVANRIRREVHALTLKGPVSVSGGIAAFPVDAKRERQLFEFADKALYRAKAEGKNRICLFHKERRRFARLETEAKITIAKVSKQPAPQEKLAAVNISGGGIAFRHDQPVPISSFIEALVHLRKSETIPFKGKVVRLEEVQKNQYEVGVRFTWVKKENRQRMRRFIEEHRQS
ncbi:MAG: diguanylate cyclase [Planctomycetota bacterium]